MNSICKHCLKCLDDNRFLLLLMSLVLFIFVVPYLMNVKYGAFILTTLTLLVLMSVVFTTLDNRIWFAISCVMALAILSMYFTRQLNEAPWNVMIYLCLTIAFYFFAVVTIFTDIVRAKRMGREMLFAGLAVYLLLGIAYASAYQLVEIIYPGSFIYDNGLQLSQKIDFYDFKYFSFTTLTTVGFGDIIPVTPYAKSVVVLEEITGVLYLAAIVARLVSVSSHYHAR